MNKNIINNLFLIGMFFCSAQARSPYAREARAVLDDPNGPCAQRETLLRGVGGLPTLVEGKRLLRRIDAACEHVRANKLEEEEGLRQLPSVLAGLASVETLYEHYRARYGEDDRCYLMTPEMTPKLYELVDECAAKFKVVTPRIFIADAPCCPLVGVGGLQQDASVMFIASGFLDQATSGELSAVIGHEMAHLAGDHIQTRAFLSFFVMLLLVLLFLALLALYVRYVDLIPLTFTSIGLLCSVLAVYEVGTLLPKVSEKVMAYYNRSCEFAADAGGAQAYGERAMVNALQQLEYVHERYMTRYRKTYEQAEQMIVIKAAEWPWLQDFLRGNVAQHRKTCDAQIVQQNSQHPPFKDRIARLQ